MKKSISFAVMGGDLRQAVLAQLLAADGHRVTVFALDRHTFDNPEIRRLHAPDFGLQDTQAIILPMPVEREIGVLNAPLSNTTCHTQTILDAIPSGKLILGGAVSDSVRERAARNRLHLIDYLAREEMAIRNAVPTCEGALQIAMEELPITLHGAKTLVIGNGRIGSMLSGKLRALGAKVWVSARSPKDFAKIDTAGMQHLHTGALSGQLADFDLVINTVPARVLGQAELAELRPDCLILDLASNPGGVDFDAARQLGRHTVWALSLPGKVAPVSAAQIIRDTIYNILQEEALL